MNGQLDTVVAAFAAAVAIACAVSAGAPKDRLAAGHSSLKKPAPTRHRWLSVRIAAVVLALAVALFVGGGGGIVTGVILGAVAYRLVPTLETASARHRRERLERQVPLTIDLIAACLAAGAPTDAALKSAALSVGDPIAAVISGAVAATLWGTDPVIAWSGVADVDGLSGLARAVIRSIETGAPLADLLPRVADEARAITRARLEARARTAAVRLTAPLGLAFLPAFVLLGVVPVVASWIGVLVPLP